MGGLWRKVFTPCLVLLLVLILSPSLVLAGGNAGWFTGLSLGQNSHSGYELDQWATSKDDTDLGYGVYGGYTWGPFAVSTGYVDLGTFNARGTGDSPVSKADDEPIYGDFTDKISASGWLTSIHGLLPVGKKVALVASLGLLRWNQDVDWEDGSGPWTGSASGSSFSYGAGVAVALNDLKSVVAIVQWQQFNNVGDLDATGHELDISYLSVGVSYYFGK